MRLLLFLAGIIVITTTLLPIIREQSWWIRIFDFPRLQITVIGGLTVLLYLTVWQPLKSYEIVLISILLAAIGYQVLRIFPYTVLANKQVLEVDGEDISNTVTLLISNVLMTNRRFMNYRRILSESQPDIVFLAEADNWWESQMQQIEKNYPFSLKYPLDNTYGMLLYSKLELHDPQIKFLVEKDVPSMHAAFRLRSGQIVELHCLHPRPPYPSESDDTEERDAELLIVGKTAKAATNPVIVAGDLNDVAWSYTTRLFQRTSGLLDPRIGRGFYNTFHAKYPFMRFPLDHIFHSEHFRLLKIERKGYFGSDHFPIYASLVYQVRTPAEQEEPEMDKEDRQNAREKIQEGQ